jgi:hypothetical protein
LETSPIRCPKCETELTNQSKFCHSCGTKLTEDSEETPISSLFGFFGRLQKTSSNDDKDYDDDYDSDEENDDDNNDIDWDNYEMKSEDELRAMFDGDNEDDEENAPSSLAEVIEAMAEAEAEKVTDEGQEN